MPSTRLRWIRDTSTPARMYDAEDFHIIYDPAGIEEGEPGGYHVSRGSLFLGIKPTLRAAKQLAEEHR